MPAETRKELETYLAGRARTRNVEATLTERGGYVTITGVSVAGNPRREMSCSTEFRGLGGADKVRGAIDRLMDVLGSC